MKTAIWVFILAGQSNMSGRATIEAIDTITSDRILVLSEAGEWEMARPPLHYNEPGLAALGPGMYFARAVLDHVPDSVSIGLVPCAVGGTSAADWVYDREVRGVRLLSNVKKQIAAAGAPICAVLWQQGEADVQQKADPSRYGAMIDGLFARFRAMAGNPDLPVLVGEVAPFASADSCSLGAINQVIRHGVRCDPSRRLVPTSDLFFFDGIHFNSESQRELGGRFAEAYLLMR